MASTSLEALIRRGASWEALVAADPQSPGWEHVLYEAQVLAGHYDPVEDERFARSYGLGRDSYERWIRHRRLRNEGRLWLVSGAPLSSETRAAFELDGARYVSVRAFYDSLKVDDELTRAAIAAGVYEGPRGRIQRPRPAPFRYRDHSVDLGSIEHCSLVARATEAKVRAHADVRAALLATGHARLYMGAFTPLGRSMPFALMVLRERLR